MKEQNFTEIQLYPLTGFNNLKAMASVNYRGVILRGLKLLEKDGELWLGMPSRKRGDRWEDIYFFADAELRKELLEVVSEKYRKEINDEPEPAKYEDAGYDRYNSGNIIRDKITAQADGITVDKVDGTVEKIEIIKKKGRKSCAAKTAVNS